MFQVGSKHVNFHLKVKYKIIGQQVEILSFILCWNFV